MKQKSGVKESFAGGISQRFNTSKAVKTEEIEYRQYINQKTGEYLSAINADVKAHEERVRMESENRRRVLAEILTDSVAGSAENIGFSNKLITEV